MNLIKEEKKYSEMFDLESEIFEGKRLVKLNRRNVAFVEKKYSVLALATKKGMTQNRPAIGLKN